MKTIKVLRKNVESRHQKIIWRYKQTEYYRYACFVKWYGVTTGWAWK